MSNLSILHALLGGRATNGLSSAESAGRTSTGPSGLNFERLLNAARSGVLTSDRPVEAVDGAEGVLNGEQLQRIAVATDHAEAAGMSSALVLIDGVAVKVDVMTREATAVIDPRAVAVTDIDGVLAAPPSTLSQGFAALAASGQGESSGPAAGLERLLLSRLSPAGAPGSVAVGKRLL